MTAPRIGTGIDVHTFDTEGRTGLWLAGVHFPAEVALAGHSDGDVAAHAAVDAMLLAAGVGDLGSVFGTADPQWAGASGVALLEHTGALVTAAGFAVGNISVQVIGNRPAVAPVRDEAEQVLSAAAGGPVSLSGTTTDGMGLTGRGEGLAAIATALLIACS